MARILYSNSYSFIIFYVIVFATFLQGFESVLIDDFRSSGTSEWKEVSDIYHNGQSVSSFVSRSFKESQKAVLFTLLVPCKRNASLAGIVKRVSIDISNSRNIMLKIKGRGEYQGYEFVLRHNGDVGDFVPSYVTYFRAPVGHFKTLFLPIDGFTAYRQGLPVPDSPPLNRKNITAVAILAYGGAHRPEKQSGAAALEIEWISTE